MKDCYNSMYHYGDYICTLYPDGEGLYPGCEYVKRDGRCKWKPEDGGEECPACNGEGFIVVETHNVGSAYVDRTESCQLCQQKKEEKEHLRNKVGEVIRYCKKVIKNKDNQNNKMVLMLAEIIIEVLDGMEPDIPKTAQTGKCDCGKPFEIPGWWRGHPYHCPECRKCLWKPKPEKEQEEERETSTEFCIQCGALLVHSMGETNICSDCTLEQGEE